MIVVPQMLQQPIRRSSFSSTKFKTLQIRSCQSVCNYICRSTNKKKTTNPNRSTSRTANIFDDNFHFLRAKPHIDGKSMQPIWSYHHSLCLASSKDHYHHLYRDLKWLLDDKGKAKRKGKQENTQRNSQIRDQERINPHGKGSYWKKKVNHQKRRKTTIKDKALLSRHRITVLKTLGGGEEERRRLSFF